MTRLLTLVVMAACVGGCSKDDEAGKKRDKDREDERDDDRRKKKHERDDEDEGRKKRPGDKERDKDLEDDVLDGLERYRDEACDCKTAACAEKVNEDFRAWRKKMKSKMKDADKPPERILERLNKLDKELRECVRKHKASSPAVPTSP